jgi:uncharacterized protein YndB with AHSA1/START domain
MSVHISSVILEKTFNSAIDKVWEAWTNPSFIMNWFGSDPNGIVLKAELDVRPGGYFEVTFQDSDQTVHTCSGIYQEVHALIKLSFTWQWKSEPDVESFIILLLIPEGNSTRMQFEHKHLKSGSKHDYTIGWQNTFLKLEKLLSGSTKLEIVKNQANI